MFHKTEEVTEKERLPKVLHVSHILGTASKFFSAECTLLRLGLYNDTNQIIIGTRFVDMFNTKPNNLLENKKT